MTEPFNSSPETVSVSRSHGPDRTALLMIAGLGACVAGFALITTLDRAALRRATGNAEAITTSLLEYADRVAHAGPDTMTDPHPYPAAGTPYPAAPAGRVNGHDEHAAAAAAASERSAPGDADDGAPADS